MTQSIVRRGLVAAALLALVSLPASAQQTLFFAGVASAGGANNTQWRSEAVLSNVSSSPAEVLLEIVPRDAEDVTASKALTLAAGETRRIPDVYAAMGAGSGAGTLRVTGDVLTWVRTFNQGAKGTFGLDVPGVDDLTALPPGIPICFPVAAPADAAKEPRSNLLLLNLEEETVTFTLTSGSVTKTLDVLAGVFTQINGVGDFMGLPSGLAMLSVTSTGSWSGLVSTIDPILGDPTPVRGLRDTTRTVTRFCGVASAPGVNNTQWRSQATFYNPRAAAQTITLELIPRGETGIAAHTTLALQPGEVKQLADVYTALGAASGAGTLRVTGDVLTWVRTFNQDSGATFGQDVPAADPATAFGPGAIAALPISAPADAATDFRSNALFYNHETVPVTLTLTAGSLSKTYDLPASTFVQLNGVGDFLGLPPGVATVSISGTGRWSCIVSTIDPAYGDPTAVFGILTTPNPLPTAEGTASGAPTTATIGPAGGSLASSDGRFSLTVPAGALSAPTALTIQPVTNTASSGVGLAYRVDPRGTHFAVPARLSFKLMADDLDRSSPTNLLAASQDAAGYWRIAPRTITQSARAPLDAPGPGIDVETNDSGTEAVAMEYKLKAAKHVVKRGETIALYVQLCPAGGVLGDCVDVNRRSRPSTYNWSVQEVTGGSSYLGKIKGAAAATGAGHYTAPAQRPTPSKLRLSAMISTGVPSDDQIILDLVNIYPPDWHGFFSLECIIPNIDWSPPQIQQTFTIDSKHIGLNYTGFLFKGEASYDIEGFVEMKTTEFDLGHNKDIPCTLAEEASKKIGPDDLFVVSYVHPYSVSWTFNMSWKYVCHPKPPAPPSEKLMAFAFATRNGDRCDTRYLKPNSGSDEWLHDHFIQACDFGFTNVMSWNFDLGPKE